MKTTFGCANWRDYIPVLIDDSHPEYEEFYQRAWELAYEHIKFIPGMPQNPYMDEAFCETQIWIWDSCFMSLFCKYAREAFPGVETLNNFYEVLYGGKHLPSVIPTEEEPAFTRRIPGVPYEIQIDIADNPPLFAWAEYENALMSGDKEYIKELLYESQVLQKHYDWFENLHETTKPDGVLAVTWLKAERDGYKWEGGRSGMDNTPRGRIGDHALEARPNNPDMLWIDAICQQALVANMIGRMFALIGDQDNHELWQERYQEKKEIVNRLYWDDKDRFYYDIDCNSHEFYKVMSIASYWALTAEIASEEQADAMVQRLFEEDTFGGIVPFPSVARNDNDYLSDGRYWRGSVWLPTAYAALRGLIKYGRFEEARSTASKLLEHMYKTYQEFTPHTLWECYAPEAYKPGTVPETDKVLSRPDFCGWSALGPISIYIECILGFHTIDAFEKVVEWEKPSAITGKIGIKNLRFGDIVTEIVAEGNHCNVVSNEEYTLKICGKVYTILKGNNEFYLNY